MPTIGRPAAGSVRNRQAPTTAWAAWLSIDRQIGFRPYSPPDHKIIMTFAEIRSGESKGE